MQLPMRYKAVFSATITGVTIGQQYQPANFMEILLRLPSKFRSILISARPCKELLFTSVSVLQSAYFSH